MMTPESALSAPDENDLSEFTIGAHVRDKAALDALLPAVYDELRALAGRYLRHERPDHTLQPTALVNEAYMRLSAQRQVDWHDRAQFFGVAAQMMRRILVNYAEARNTAKRGGLVARVTLDESTQRAGIPISLDQDWRLLGEPLEVPNDVASSSLTIVATANPGECILVDDVVVESATARAAHSSLPATPYVFMSR